MSDSREWSVEESERRTHEEGLTGGFNPWVIALVVTVPTFMEVLDTSVANVALRYIAGGLSAAEADSEWVITSYLAANAIILPMSGWLALRLGRRNYFLLSIAVFTLASALCGLATRAAASAPPSRRPSTSGATNCTACTWAKISTS